MPYRRGVLGEGKLGRLGRHGGLCLLQLLP